VKIRNIGLSTGLTFSALAFLGGFLLISMAESMNFVSGEGGGGFALLMQWIGYWLMYGLGYLLAAAGASIAIITIFSWLFSKAYSLLSPQNKKKVQWGMLILLVIGISITAVTIHLRSQPEAIAQRAMEKKAQYEERAEAKAVREAIEIKVANEKLQTMNKLILGKWENELNQWKPSLVFEEQGKLYTTTYIDQINTDGTTWALSLNTKSPYYITLNSPYSVIRNRSQASSKVKVVALDEQRLILEGRCGFSCGKDGLKAIRETYSRVVGEERCQAAKEQIKGLWTIADAGVENIHALFQENDTVYYTNGVDWVYQGRATLKCTRYRSDSLRLYLEIYAKTCPKCARHHQDIYISQLDSKQLKGAGHQQYLEERFDGKYTREKFTRNGIENEREQIEAILNLITLKQKEGSLEN